MSFNHYIAHKDDIYKYATELLASVWPMPAPVRCLALKLSNLRYRTKADFDGPLSANEKEQLQFFMGKGRKKGCVAI